MSMEEPLVQPAPAEHNDHDDQAGHGHAHGAVKHSDDDANGPEAEPAKNPNEARNKLIKATALCFCFMVAELVGGLLAHSLAIMTDAAHLLSDLAGFAISIIAIQLAKKEANLSYSFGYHRAEILGALASVMLIWALTAVLVFEAIDRLQDPRKIHVDGLLMFIISILGIAVNGAMMLVLGGHGHSHAGGGDHGHSHGASGQTGHAHGAGSDEEHGHSHGGHDGDKEEEEDGEGAKNINVEAAWVHVLGDLVQGVGVMIAAILIWWAPGMTTCSKYDLDCGHWMKNQETSPTGIPIGGLSGKFWVGQDEGTFKSGINWYVADPACTLLFSVLVMYTTTGIVRSSISVLMAKAPENVNVAKLKSQLLAIHGVTGMHDLHVWMVSVGKNAVTTHLDVDSLEAHGSIMKQAQKICLSYGLDHNTIQLDLGGHCIGFDHGGDWDQREPPTQSLPALPSP